MASNDFTKGGSLEQVWLEICHGAESSSRQLSRLQNQPELSVGQDDCPRTDQLRRSFSPTEEVLDHGTRCDATA